MTRFKLLSALLAATLCASAAAQSSQPDASTAAQQLNQLRDQLKQQQEKIDQLSTSLADLKSTDAGLTETVVANQASLSDAITSPATLHYKGVEITPIGFFAAEGAYRSRSLNSDINTPFNSQTFPGYAQYNTSELNFSARQSRLGVLAVGKVGKATLNGYFEGDMLGSGTTSNDNQSNSYVFRQRLFFGQAAFTSGWTITGGQTWSLVTETKSSTDARSEVLPQTPDAQYVVGFSWARQPGFRVAKKSGNFTTAVSFEQTENIFSASNAYDNFFIGNVGTSGGLFNAFNGNYTNNLTPDMIVKFTYDNKRWGHYEIGGVSRYFRDRVYPGYATTAQNATAQVGQNDSKLGGGIFANAHFIANKYFEVGLHGMFGPGVGRYGSSSLPDTTVHPDGTLEPIKSSQGLFTIVYHPTPKLDVFGYAGGEYAQRTVYSYNGKLTGYGPWTNNVSGCDTETGPSASSGYGPGTPANCSATTRDLLEGTLSLIYRFYNGPKGRVQTNVAWSYLKRETWSGLNTGVALGSSSPFGNNNMVFTSLRYYLP